MDNKIELVHCKKYLDEIKEASKIKVQELKDKYGVTPCVAIIKMGNSEDTNRYVRNKSKHITDIGASVRLIEIDDQIILTDLLDIIHSLNKDEGVNAIIVQEPLYPSLPSDYGRLLIHNAISTDKDLDCFNPKNLGRLVMNNGFVEPCTPKGIMYLLEKMNVDLEGKNVLILGRSLIVGKPLQIMMTNANATVTLAHSKSQLDSYYDGMVNAAIGGYDIVISAIGKGHAVKIKKMNNAVIIDVGINFDDDGKMIGDIDLETCERVSGWATPVPGGVGLLTCAMVIENLLSLTERQIIEKEY